MATFRLAWAGCNCVVCSHWRDACGCKSGANVSVLQATLTSDVSRTLSFFKTDATQSEDEVIEHAVDVRARSGAVRLGSGCCNGQLYNSMVNGNSYDTNRRMEWCQ